MKTIPYKLSVVLNRLKERGTVRVENGEWRTRCPAHDDSQPSCYVRLGGDHILINCIGGCEFEDIIAKLDLVPADLFLDDDASVEIDDEWAMPAEAKKPRTEKGQAQANNSSDNLQSQIYQEFLGHVALSEKHRSALQKRGLNDEAIARGEYRSVERFASHQAIGKLVTKHTQEGLLRVPGFVHRNDRVELAAREGLIVPVRDRTGGIVAFKIRREDDDEGPKYSYVSSAPMGGPSPGAPIHFPMGTPQQAVEVRVTEGELKADVSFALSTLPTLSVPGVSNWSGVLDELRVMNAKIVRVAFDADGKPATRAATAALIDTLRTEGFQPCLEQWSGDHKGIDDLLVNGGTPTVLREAEMNAALQQKSTDEVCPSPESHPETDTEDAPLPAAPSGLLSFPLHILPPSLRAFIAEVGQATSTPTDYAGLALLTIAGAAIGNARQVCLKPGSWYEPPLLFAAAVGDPSMGKTPAIDLVVKPYEQLQQALLHNYEKEQASFQLAEKQREQINEENKSLPKGEKKPLPEPPSEPVQPERLLTTEATSEALHVLMKQNPRGLVMYVDELVGWVRGQGQYKGGRGNDRQLWLSVWSGKAFTVDRKGQGGVVTNIPRAFVAVLGGLQPDMLNELEDHRRRNDGFIHRLLFAYPAVVSDTKWNENTVSPESRQAWVKTLCSLRQLSMQADVTKETFTNELSPPAKKLWVEWFERHKKEQRSSELSPSLIGPWGKLVSYAARFALILFHLRVAHGQAEDAAGIDAASLQGAIALVDYFKAHASAVYGRLELTPDDNRAMRALNWLRKHGDRCTPRELQRAGIPGISKASEAQKVLKNLADSGYGRLEEQPGGRGTRSFAFVFDPQ